MTLHQPDQVKIAIARPDGGVTIMAFVTKSYRPGFDENGNRVVEFEREPTPENVQAEIRKAGLAMSSWWLIADDEVPQDRTFRNAWTMNGSGIVHDMAKAREIHRARMRQARVPLLAALDVEFIRADEAMDETAKADVIARKTALRNVTADPAIEAAKTPEALKAVWPEILK